MNDDSKTANVAAPPPLIFGATLALGVLLGRTFGVGEPEDPVAAALGNFAIAAGLAVGAASVVAFKRAGTNVNPYAPSTSLVTNGVFARSRNPIYVAMTSLYIGIALRARSIPALVLLPVVLALLDSGVVDREERYLERTFGEAYRAYRERVPRWF